MAVTEAQLDNIRLDVAKFFTIMDDMVSHLRNGNETWNNLVSRDLEKETKGATTTSIAIADMEKEEIKKYNILKGKFNSYSSNIISKINGLS
jgi:hypothetical protein